MDEENTTEFWDDEPIHNHFGLSYAEYLTIPRSALQSMPKEWQKRFVQCLAEIDQTIECSPAEGYEYRVQLYKVDLDGIGGDFWVTSVDDPLRDYRRGSRQLPLISDLTDQ